MSIFLTMYCPNVVLSKREDFFVLGVVVIIGVVVILVVEVLPTETQELIIDSFLEKLIGGVRRFSEVFLEC